MSKEALQIAVKRKEAKGKGEKERYTHLNAEFQRIARREKKAFFSDQCKEIEANNRMGKTRDLYTPSAIAILVKTSMIPPKRRHLLVFVLSQVAQWSRICLQCRRPWFNS